MYITREKGKNKGFESATGKGSKKYGKKKEAPYSG